MDTGLLILAGWIILFIVSLVFGIRFFKKYKKSGKKLHLILAIFLTFIIPGLMIYVTYILLARTAISYMPYPGPEPGMDYMPSPF